MRKWMFLAGLVGTMLLSSSLMAAEQLQKRTYLFGSKNLQLNIPTSWAQGKSSAPGKTGKYVLILAPKHPKTVDQEVGVFFQLVPDSQIGVPAATLSDLQFQQILRTIRTDGFKHLPEDFQKIIESTTTIEKLPGEKHGAFFMLVDKTLDSTKQSFHDFKYLQIGVVEIQGALFWFEIAAHDLKSPVYQQALAVLQSATAR